MPTDVSPPHPCRRFDVIDEETGQRTAVGTELPSGTLVVEWIPESFPEDEQTNQPVISQYRNRADAEQATGGTLIFEDPS